MDGDAGPDMWRDLQIGLATVDSFQASIRHADAKALALLAAGGGTAATVADRVLPTMFEAGPVIVVLTVFLVTVMAVAAVATTGRLVMSLRPRLAGAGGANRFGFPDLVADGRPAAACVQRHRDEAWDFAVALARIALTKHLLIRSCFPWFVTMLGSAAGAVAVSGVAGVTP